MKLISLCSRSIGRPRYFPSRTPCHSLLANIGQTSESIQRFHAIHVGPDGGQDHSSNCGRRTIQIVQHDRSILGFADGNRRNSRRSSRARRAHRSRRSSRSRNTLGARNSGRSLRTGRTVGQFIRKEFTEAVRNGDREVSSCCICAKIGDDLGIGVRSFQFPNG